jgi:hypothetical protein
MRCQRVAARMSVACTSRRQLFSVNKRGSVFVPAFFDEAALDQVR